MFYFGKKKSFLYDVYNPSYKENTKLDFFRGRIRSPDFSSPISPMINLLSSLGIMLCVKPQLPGLIEEIGKLIITCVFDGLCLEFFINGKRYGS